MTRCCIPLAMTCLIYAHAALAEEWTDITGKYQVEAELVDFDDQSVHLKRDADGKVVTVPVAKLSTASQEYLRSLGSPADYRAIRDLCAEIRRTWLDSPSVDTAWPGDFMFIAFDLLAEEPNFLNWEQTIEAARQFRGPEASFDEAVPADTPARWQALGPLALVHLPLARVRKGENWDPIDVMLVAVRREDRWRAAASVLGNWRLGAEDVYNPQLEDHRAIGDCYAQVEESFEAANADLLIGLMHPMYRSFMTLPETPDRPLVTHLADLDEMLSKGLAAYKVRESSYKLQYVRTQGPLAVAIADACLTVDNGREDTHLSVDFLCKTEDGWRVALSPAGDWRRILVNGPYPATEPGGVANKASLSQLCDRVRSALVAKDREAFRETVWEDEFLGISDNRTPLGFGEIADQLEAVWQAVPEISAPEEVPTGRTEGPVALVHLPAYQLHHPSATETVDSLVIAAKRDGQWRLAAMLFGRWGFGADDGFDPEKTDHREIEDFLGQIAQAAEKRQVNMLATHPRYRLVAGNPDDAESALLLSGEDIQQKMVAAGQPTGSLSYKYRIHNIHVRQDVALVQTERHVEVDGRAWDNFFLFLFCRTGSGWKQTLAVLGDWRPILVQDWPAAESEGGQAVVSEAGWVPVVNFDAPSATLCPNMTLDTFVGDARGISNCDVDTSEDASGSAHSLRWSYHTKKEVWVQVDVVLQGSREEFFDLSQYDSVSFHVKGYRPGSAGFMVHGKTIRPDDDPWVVLGFDYTDEWSEVTIALEPDRLSTLDLRKVYQFSFGYLGSSDSDDNVLWIDEIQCHRKGDGVAAWSWRP